MTTKHQTIAAGMLLRLVRLVESRGQDSARLFEGVGLTRQVLDNTHARVPYELNDLLLERAADLLGSAGLGLALARSRIDESYGAAGLLLVASGTLRQGFSRSFAYQRLWGDGERFALTPLGSDVAVRFRHPGPSALAGAIATECALCEVIEGARSLAEAGAAPLRVELRHTALGPADELTDYFGVTPAFNCAESRLVLSAELVDRPIHALRDLLSAAIESQALRALALLPGRDSSVQRVRALVERELGAVGSLGEVAKALRMSPRTLQRRLRQEGTTFQELVDAERQAQAQVLEQQGLPAKEAAFRLGYQDSSALTRARRRWRAS